MRAFWGALRMTLRGEKISPVVDSPLSGWTRQYGQLVNAILQVADQNGVDPTMRQQIKLRVDGRQMNLETALMTLKFHATEEYPSLLRHGTRQGVLATFYATNLNDHYWVTSMAALAEFQKPALQTAIKTLEAHLDGVPRVDPT